MKLDIETTGLETKGTLTEETFGISDMGFVLELLRNKLYSNIKKAICQEYTCNARDAHRETGNDDEPIKISLPNFFDPNWRCRDFGPGISPDRVSNVFVMYGSSTKRASNVQVGSFGIGAKSALGYSDSFIINTFIDGIHRSYSVVIDDSRCGKMIMLSEGVTTERNGTEIIVPVRPSDFSEFALETDRACRHWKVQPIVSGGNGSFEFTKNPVILSGTDWKIVNSNNYYGTVSVILDGVEYPIDVNKTIDELPFTLSSNTALYLMFNTGDLMVSANREQIEVNAKSRAKLLSRLAEIEVELLSSLQKKISEASSYLEAHVFARHGLRIVTTKHNFSDFEWNGRKLQDAGVLSFEKCGNVYRYYESIGRKGKKSLNSSYCGRLSIVDEEYNRNCKFMIVPDGIVDDVIKATVQNALNTTKASTIVVFTFDSNKPEYRAAFDAMNLDYLPWIKFEDYNKPKVSRKAAMARMTFYKLGKETVDIFSRTSLKEFEADTAELKLFTRIHKRDTSKTESCPNGVVVATSGKNHNIGLTEMIRQLAENSTEWSLYGFSNDLPEERIAEVTEDMEDLKTFVNEKIAETGILPGEIFSYNYNYNRSRYDVVDALNFDKDFYKHLQAKYPTLLETAILFNDWITEMKKYEKKNEKLSKLMFASSFLEESAMIAPSLSLSESTKKMMIAYPMVGHTFAASKTSKGGAMAEDIVNYIVMMDKIRAEQNESLSCDTIRTISNEEV